MADPHWGPWGCDPPPFQFPISSICTKRLFCRYLIFSLHQILKEVMPVFAPKVQFYIIIFKNFPGGTNALRVLENAPLRTKISKIFQG